MNEIVCPHCTKAFRIDEAGYAAILKQVRDREFEEQIRGRLMLADREKENAVALAESRFMNQHQSTVAAKDSEIQLLQSRIESIRLTNELSTAQAMPIGR